MRRLSLRHLRAFVAVAETGSFTLAAARIFQTQSALTATIRQFEESVGIKLFDRTTRRVELTDDAIRFKPVADRILRDFDAAMGDLQAISTGHQGRITIAAIPSVIAHVLVPALAELRRSHPGIDVSVFDGGTERIERMVLDGEVDFGICGRHANYPELNYQPLVRDCLGIVCPPDHPLAACEPAVAWRELAAHDYTSLTESAGTAWMLEAHPELTADRQPVPRSSASSVTTLRALLDLGGRYSVLPALAARSDPMTAFVFRPLDGPRVTREVCLLTRNLRTVSGNTRRILSSLVTSLGLLAGTEGVEILDLDSIAAPAAS